LIAVDHILTGGRGRASPEKLGRLIAFRFPSNPAAAELGFVENAHEFARDEDMGASSANQPQDDGEAMHTLLERSAIILALCGLPAGAARAAETVVVKLSATSYAAGEVGQATVIADNGATRLVLNFTGVPRNTTQPVHVYTYIYEGRCTELSAKPVYSLNDRVLVSTPSGRTGYGARGPFRLLHSVPVGIDELLGGRYVLGLRTAPADGDYLIYCGELRKS
jgi:hypothetical protein